jgi:aspartate/methionine/tyrosine aminotransferase
MDASTELILKMHRDLDRRSRTETAAPFISGWQTAHPLAEEYLNASHWTSTTGLGPDRYSFLSDSVALVNAIRRFHAGTDRMDYPADAVFASSGSSPLLMSFFLALPELGIGEVHLAPPVYYSCYYFCRSLGLPTRHVSQDLLDDAGAVMDLPDRRSALVICDPIWVFGTTVHSANLDRIREWQRATGSVVLVDGTFQYTRWDDHSRAEPTSTLVPEQTFRIVCPTKSLAVHGVRFAYMLVPPQMRESIRYPCSNITGATGLASEHFALRLMEVLNSPTGNRDLVGYIRTMHGRLRSAGVIISEARDPVASYYIFGEIRRDIADYALAMDERFFGISGFPGRVRINLLYPRWADILAATGFG